MIGTSSIHARNSLNLFRGVQYKYTWFVYIPYNCSVACVNIIVITLHLNYMYMYKLVGACVYIIIISEYGS